MVAGVALRMVCAFGARRVTVVCPPGAVGGETIHVDADGKPFLTPYGDPVTDAAEVRESWTGYIDVDRRGSPVSEDRRAPKDPDPWGARVKGRGASHAVVVPKHIGPGEEFRAVIGGPPEGYRWKKASGWRRFCCCCCRAKPQVAPPEYDYSDEEYYDYDGASSAATGPPPQALLEGAGAEVVKQLERAGAGKLDAAPRARLGDRAALRDEQDPDLAAVPDFHRPAPSLGLG